MSKLYFKPVVLTELYNLNYLYPELYWMMDFRLEALAGIVVAEFVEV